MHDNFCSSASGISRSFIFVEVMLFEIFDNKLLQNKHPLYSTYLNIYLDTHVSVEQYTKYVVLQCHGMCE